MDYRLQVTLCSSDYFIYISLTYDQRLFSSCLKLSLELSGYCCLQLTSC